MENNQTNMEELIREHKETLLREFIEIGINQGYKLALLSLTKVYNEEIQKATSQEFKDGFNFAISLLKEAESLMDKSMAG